MVSRRSDGLCLLLLVMITVSNAQPFGPDARGGTSWPAMFVKELTSKNFNETLSKHDGPILIEFYAAWCPKCKSFATDYERVAYAVTHHPPQPSNLLFAKIDCYTDNIAGESTAAGGQQHSLPSWQVCIHLGITGYPRLLYVSHRNELWNKSKEALQTENRVVLTPLVAGELLGYVNRQLNRTYGLPDPGQFAMVVSDHLHELEHPITTTAIHMAKGAVIPDPNIDIADDPHSPQYQMAHLHDYHFDVEIATAVLIDHMFRGQPRYGDGLTPEKRVVVFSFVDALERAYPVPQCRPSLTQFRKSLVQLWPSYDHVKADDPSTNVTYLSPDKIRESFSLCDRRDWKLYEKRGWLACHGTYSWTRGYSCGLWLLFHSLVGHASAQDAPSVLLAIRGVIELFFPCEHCRTHFLEATRSELISKLRTQREIVMFLWEIHNQVNTRLQRDERCEHGNPASYISQKPGSAGKTEYETSFSGDPAFPHQPWPTLAECTGCKSTKLPEKDSSGKHPEQRFDRNAPPRWDLDAVYQFLSDRYGSTMLVTSDDYGPWSAPKPKPKQPPQHLHHDL